MHALGVMITKSLRNGQMILDRMQDDGRFDYCGIGGRYDHLIPVNPNVKEYVNTPGVFNPDGNDRPWGYNNPRLDEVKYVDIARLRNVRMDIATDMLEHNVLGILNPYNYIIDVGDGDYEWIESRDMWDTIYAFMTKPSHGAWFVIVIDYHY